MIGWAADPAHCPEVRKFTHDKLIASMGDTRAGGVVWLQWSGPEAIGVLAELRRDMTDPDMIEYLRRMRRKVEEFGGHVIMAKAPAYPRTGHV